MRPLQVSKVQLITYGFPLLVILIAASIAVSPLADQSPSLSWALTFDLTLTAPILFLILSRKSKTSKIKAIPFFVLGIAVAGFLLPKEEQLYLNYVKAYLLPLVELVVLLFLVVKTRRAVSIFKANEAYSSDFFAICRQSARELFGKSSFGAFIASEISMIYYTFSSWKKRPLANTEYSNYKENGSIPLYGAIIAIILIETIVFHILLIYFELRILAWILSLSSLYTGLLIFAHIRALIKRPSVLTKTELHLKNGLIADIVIKLDTIERVEIYTSELISKDQQIGNLGLSKESTNHNLALYFKTPQTINKAYGFSTNCDVLLFHLDAKNKFVKDVRKAIKEDQKM